ncbi:lanosterol 14-alpha demethylase [Endogone sp. FLAS-F59071]|nr:lanosterol 14-alpha demethylase [Endogone sp. FLAS-F59071]|eukprot:RUS17280.1 lanosterol 14-alpha demethylase [Endogone sp. FLAS-F59071]
MSSIFNQTHIFTPLIDKIPQAASLLAFSSLLIAIPVYLVVFVALAIVFNALGQVLIKPDPRYPPMVFYWLPYIGSAISFGANPIKFMQDCQKKYGDCFTYKLIGRRITVCLGPDGNYFAFNGKATVISIAEAYKTMTTPVFGKEVVYDAPHHVFMEQKKLEIMRLGKDTRKSEGTYAFGSVGVKQSTPSHTPRLKISPSRFIKLGLSIENLRKHVPMMIEETYEYFENHFAKPSGEIDIHKAMSELIINTASRCLLGKEIRSTLGTEGSEIAELYADLDNGFQPINYLFPNLPLPSYRKRDHANKRMAQIYSKIIQKRRESGDTSNIDIVQTLMEQSYKDGTPVPDHHIAHIMIATLFGGQHTSATTSTWAILELAHKPELIRALQQEQIEALGSLSEPLDYDSLKKLILLDSVVRETLRLHPPLFQLMRKVMSDITFDKTGHVIPTGDYLTVSPGVTQLDPTYFKNPMEFNPRRWLDSEDGMQQLEVGADANEDYGFGAVGVSGRSPYLPFGAGRHRCIGEAFAYVQLKTILGLFVRVFDFELDPKRGLPPSDFTSMVVMPEKPSTIRYTWRKQ